MRPQFPLQILSKKFIKPATPTPYNLRKLKISSVDQGQLKIYVPFIFCYPANGHRDERAKNCERSKLLEKSLSEVLTLFYPLAGRYIEEKLLIDCNDHGVEYVEAKVAGHLAPVLKRDFDSKHVHHLIPHQSESPTSPLVAVQCNMFECGGLAIGLCISHRIVDGFVYAKFIDGWATACRIGIDKVHYRPSFDLASLFPTREVVPEITPVSQFKPELKIATQKFVFSDLAISNLRMLANGCVKDSENHLANFKPSRALLVTALIWKALIRMDQAKHGQLRPSVITHMINMRGRTNLPILDDFCGNFVRPAMVKFMPDTKRNNVEFHELVTLISDAITKAVTDCAKPQNGNEISLMVDSSWSEASEECHRDGVDSYFFTSICRMTFYPDFGWGKPVRVIRVQYFPEIIIELMDTRDGDGIEALICLEENDMPIFQQDSDIIACTPQLDSIYLRSRC